LDYLGRIDHQVKLHGFRIELGEIEANLCLHTDVKEAVVILYSGDDNQRLLAYITSDNQEIETKELRSVLKNTLPDYMIPAQIMVLEYLPLTPNGKIDRKSLPITDAIFNKSSIKQDVLPRTVTEETLAQIWVDILKLNSSQKVIGSTPINIYDDFFTMGGDSLFAVHIITQVQKIFQIKLPLRYLFDHPTIAELSKYIDTQIKAQYLLPTEKNKNWSALVPLQLAGNKKPVFIMPGGSAGEEELINLVKLVYLLGKNRPVYGLQARGWDGILPPYTSVEEMAADCIKVIQSIQPKGSYLLVGECLGGRVMLEISQQLQAQGKKIERLILIETALHDGGQNLSSLMKNIIAPKINRHWKKLSQMTLNNGLRYIFDKSKKSMGRLLSKAELVHSLSETKKIKLYKKAHKNMIFRYQPAVYSGDLILLMTKKLLKRKRKQKWATLIRANVRIYELKGDHEKITYLGEEVETTARLLKICLNNPL
jgi:thioesterase domain-containing protein/acyl carrier protein